MTSHQMKVVTIKNKSVRDRVGNHRNQVRCIICYEGTDEKRNWWYLPWLDNPKAFDVKAPPSQLNSRS